MKLNGFMVLLVISLLVGQSLIPSRVDGSPLAVPIAYEDQYITIRSLVMNIEDEIYNLGDILSFAIVAEYDTSRVRPGNLDGTLLEHSWGQLNWLSMPDGPRIYRTTVSERQTIVETVYDFQLIGCPELTPCPGGKLYQLPDITIGIELIDDEARVVSATEIKFSPWPSAIALSSALPLIGGKVGPFNFYFPRRAFGNPVPIDLTLYPAFLVFIAGFLTISGMVFAPVAKVWMRRKVPSRIGMLGSRWERVLDQLHDADMQKDKFWEGVRVAITWYCHDELSIDPMLWIVADAENTIPYEDHKELAQLRQLFMAATHMHTLDEVRRREILSMLTDFFGQK